MTNLRKRNCVSGRLALQGIAALLLLVSGLIPGGEIYAGIVILLEGMRLAQTYREQKSLFAYYCRELRHLLVIWLLTVVPGYIHVDILRRKLGAEVLAGDVFFGTYFTAGQDRFWIFLVILAGVLLMPLIIHGAEQKKVSVLRLILTAEIYAGLLFLFWSLARNAYSNVDQTLIGLPLLILGAWLEAVWFATRKSKKHSIVTAIGRIGIIQGICQVLSGIGSVWLYAWMNHRFLMVMFHEPETPGYYLFLTVFIAITAAFVQRGILTRTDDRARIPYEQISEFRGEIMGIAIIGITMTHYANHVVQAGLHKTEYVRLVAMFPCFVDVFMIISGLGMYYSFNRDSRIRSFYGKRLIKLIPPYVLIGFLSWMHWDVLLNHGGIPQLLKDFSFQTMVTNRQYRFWYIPAILCCYLLVPVLYRGLHLLKNRTLSWILVEALIFGLFALLRMLNPDVYDNLRIATERLPAFVTGMYFGGRSFNKKEMRPVTAVGIAFIAGIGQQIVRTQAYPIPRRLYYTACNVQGIYLVIAAVMLLEIGKRWRGLRLLQSGLRVIGGATLEIYLLHMSLKSVAGNPADPLLYFLTCMLAPIALGLVLHVIGDRLFPSGK